MKDFLRYSKNRFLYSLFKLLILIAIGFLIGSLKVKADTFIPTSKLQYYEGYEENINTGNSSFHEDGYSYGSNITPPLSPGYYEHPFAISLILNGSYKAGNTYIFTSTLFADIKGSTFKFYYPNLLYMAWFARLNYNDEKISCNFDMVTENSRFDITCSYQPSVDSNSAIISFVNQDWQNNGYLTYDDLGTYFKWDNINIQLYSDSSGAIIEQNQTIINQNDTIINQNKEAENTRKGIWETIKGIPRTIGTFFDNLGTKIGNFFKELLDGILEGLKKLFIPEDDYFKNWFDDFKTYFEEKLGFIATPFTIIIDFVNSYLNLSSSNDIIIDVPDITVPNFEENKIISATTFNWSQTLRSKQALNALWQLYLSFIDVYLILNFINLCENKYNRIFGGDTSNYEYYTVEDSYTFDNDTGEVLSARRNERTTTRKKVE